MSVIRTTVQNGRIEFEAPKDIPDGTDVVIDVTPAVHERIGIHESDWRDDSEALADWAAWLQSIEPIDFAQPDAFDDEFRRFNIEAVRRQMASGDNE